MSKEIESYKLGKVQVVVTEAEKPNRLLIDCNDGEFHSSFEVSEYEFQNYRRLMNQRIKEAFNSAEG